MAKKDKNAATAAEPTGTEETAELEPTDAPEPAKPASPSAPDGFVRCVVLHGLYRAERTYVAGEEVIVPADELPKLLHCMQPVEG